MSSRAFVALGLGSVCLLTQAVSAQDVYYYQIERGEYFTQATTNRPSTTCALGHNLYAYVHPEWDGSVVSATLTSPARWTLPLVEGGGYFYLPGTLGKTMNLGRAASAGTYQFHAVGANQGALGMKLSLPGSAAGILPVRIANYTAAQAVDAAQSFDLQWDKVPRRGSRDAFWLTITDASGNALVNEPNISLDTTNWTIPASTLQPNTTNWAVLHVIHPFAVDRSPQEPHWVTSERRGTGFAIKTLNPAGNFSFSCVSVVAYEGDQTAVMTVSRGQGTSGTATVDYFSSDGSAQANVNYQPVAGTLTFPPGVTNQTFAVPLLNSGGTNSPLTVHFTLTNATGGAGLAFPHANLTILDTQSPPGSNINICLLSKVEYYSQTGAAAPSQTNRSITSRFFAAVHSRFPGAVTHASVQPPRGASVILEPLFYNYQYFPDCSIDFPSPTSMNIAFPAGKYTLHVDTLTDGSFDVPVALGAERSFTIPYVTNWVAAQSIDAAAPFTLRWAPFVGATTNDCVRVAVATSDGESIVDTPDEFEPGVLPGTTPSFTIPAGTLEPGRKYWANLMFGKVVGASVNAKIGVRSAVIFVRTTSFFIQTSPLSSR